MLKKYFLAILIVFLVFNFQSCKKESEKQLNVKKPIAEKEHEERNTNPDKHAIWTPEQAARHQAILAKLSKNKISTQNNTYKSSITYANGALTGNWVIRGPHNMPGAFKFAEMLDNTDIMYAVTHNHYTSEYNSTSYIHKGTVYNPTTGTGGDDFVVLTANWPNRYKDLFAFQNGPNVRLIAHIENGPLYYSDDDGANWTLSTGLPAANKSATINRQDNNKIYSTDGTSVFVSTDFGVTFSLLKNFGTNASSFLYTPRYAVQAGSNNVYLARNGSLYKLNVAQTDFDLKGTYVASHGENEFSIGGDSGKLYITENKSYWVSTDEGVTWTEKFPHGNWYGDVSGKMDAGRFFAVHPENPDITLGGYAQPVVSIDGLDTVWTDATGWGWYQNGTNLNAADYQNRIRFNYHPDFQANHFFYNSSGTLFSARCSDGGVYISYKEWTDFPATGQGYNNTGYANAHFINLNVLNTFNPLVYRDALFTGNNDPTHINYGTQDQGSQSIIPGTSGNVLDFYQSIGGDGPNIDSQDGLNAWKWKRQGNEVWPPVKVYTAANAFKSIGSINGDFNNADKISFAGSTSYLGWTQNYIDRHAPSQRIWLLTRQLQRATWDGTTLSGHTINVGNNQVAALAQGSINGDKLFMLQDGKVFISSNRGDTFDSGSTTPFSMTSNSGGNGDIGSGVVLPGNDNWVLFAGPSNNNVGSILSKDGGTTWTDVTGVFPSGTDAQTGGMVASPDGNLIFAGTDIGPYVFVVATETWYSLAEGIGFFNAMDVDYVAATNTIRFGSWGSGILDFNIESFTLSTEENPTIADLSFKMYPNPATNFVMINLNNPENSKAEIEIFSMNGQLVSTNNYNFVSNSPLKLDVSNLSSGLYIVKIKEQHKNVKTKKLAIK